MKRVLKFTTEILLLIMFCYNVSGQAGSDEPATITAGEKNFTKIVNSDEINCAYCHYSVEPDTLNWNPSVNDLAGRVEFYIEEGIVKYFDSPEGDVLKAAHSGIKLSPGEENELIAYIGSLDDTPPVPKAGFKWRLFLIIGMFIILILIRIEKTRIRKIPRTARFILKPAVWTVILVLMFQEAIGFNLSENYAPVQPVKFSHTIHSTDNQIDCNYCHSGVINGKYAGIPPVSLCMNCHKHVKEGTRTGKFEIRKILQAAEDSIPIRWVRIHNMPDYVYFNHMQHVTVGEVECITCHGDVETMHIVRQEEDRVSTVMIKLPLIFLTTIIKPITLNISIHYKQGNLIQLWFLILVAGNVVNAIIKNIN